MQFSAVILAGFAALVSAQTYTGPGATPTAAAPQGCATTYPGSFQLSVANASTAAKAKRQSTADNALTISLSGSTLTDSMGRIGYIASNYQFQFDFGGQAGEIYSAGWSVCSNNTLALGGSAVFYQCLSGDFYNLYDRNWAPQCEPIFLDVISVSGSASVSTTTAAATETSVASAAVTSSAALVTSITDGQVQGPTTTSEVVSSISVVTSVTSATSSAAILSTISDHQIQAPTSTSVIVSASTYLSTMTTSRAVISSISDGQVQAPTATTVQSYTGAAAMPTVAAQLFLAAAGAAALLL